MSEMMIALSLTVETAAASFGQASGMEIFYFSLLTAFAALAACLYCRFEFAGAPLRVRAVLHNEEARPAASKAGAAGLCIEKLPSFGVYRTQRGGVA